jgi:hypothetical protein
MLEEILNAKERVKNTFQKLPLREFVVMLLVHQVITMPNTPGTSINTGGGESTENDAVAGAPSGPPLASTRCTDARYAGSVAASSGTAGNTTGDASAVIVSGVGKVPPLMDTANPPG